MRNTVWMGQAPEQVPGRVVVLVVVVRGRVVVVLVLVVEVVVGPAVVVVVVPPIVVLVVVVVLDAEEVVTVGWKAASTITQLVAVPRGRLPSCGPSGRARLARGRRPPGGGGRWRPVRATSARPGAGRDH